MAQTESSSGERLRLRSENESGPGSVQAVRRSRTRRARSGKGSPLIAGAKSESARPPRKTGGEGRGTARSASGRQEPGTEDRDAIAREASDAILGANPFVGIDTREVMGAAVRWLGRLAGEPATVLARTRDTALELSKIAAGRSQVQPDRGDRRFTDPAWSQHPGFRRVMQTYLLYASTLQKLVEDSALDPKTEQRARYALSLVTDALAPTNSFLTNPAAMKHAFDTSGLSLLRGARNLFGDLRHNGGMPSMVDGRPFEIGRNLAVSPGAVVHREEVFELIQYTPTTGTVYERPLVLIPPQINKFYILDLAPGRSLIEYLVGQGIPVFAVSWRNPTARHREWGLDTYVRACQSAIEVATEVTECDDCNLFGACAGGITMSMLLGHLAATDPGRVRSATLAVTVMDTQSPSMIGMFASKATIAAAIRRSQRRGYLDGQEMARVFAWLRPNDLVWNYWTNNYLMGNDPPAFDILFWNADSTRLPASLHADFLHLQEGENPFERPGLISVAGTPIDLGEVRASSYVIAGITDHIVPWQAAYGAIRMLGGPTEFVLSSSGHIQSLVNPPGNPKASYWVDGPRVTNPQDWLRGAVARRGSWWEHWMGWLGEHSGDRRPSPSRLGSAAHRPQDAAPGLYVLEK
jgi:polyhydroxyalkanoate synthase